MRMNPCYAYTKTILLCCLALSISGSLVSCANAPKLSHEQMSRTRQYQEQITLSGKISIQYQQNEKTETLSGNFDWQQLSKELTISLNSPLGQTIAIIRETPQGASLQQAKQETRYAQDVEQLLTESLGWSLPVAGLKDWLQGFDRQTNGQKLAVPTKDYQRLMSQGWQIDFTTWQEDQQQVHPKLINLYRRTEELGELKIRIAILEWNADQNSNTAPVGVPSTP
ncbi:lipoprotein insertase outer membrane protein LolB [Undibacterium cyanobacteriorum]|uniref:Outer-membrane lipoprotein LolB n=1 Tax=Undibacterium cyanobacteriorum TaxID=3073561 RepID=A0ABY9RM40_9BURK|nr:lipoprotein insertase outer membrane protein LolB [Undibacterium sp. 20NA77.5]WMW81477.1 lipoprotein insertase outer membrane protein LolB [Undibacterium sp. 20NA77.5]